MIENNNNTNKFIKVLAEREKVSEEKIKEIITNSFRESYCKGENSEADLHFEFGDNLLVYRIYKIVEKLNDSNKETLKDSEQLNQLLKTKDSKIKNDVLLLPLDIKNLSLLTSHGIKEQLRKNIGEIKEKNQHKLYQSLKGELAKGSIQNYQEKYYVVNLGKGIGHWDKEEWKLPERPRLGQSFYFLIKEVREKSEKGSPQIIITRQDDLFVLKLLELEIPEIKEKIIKVKQILRVPGLIKLIVESKRAGVDPLGTCIGKNAERIRAISRIIYPERIDIVAWSEDKKTMLFNLLSPVKIVSLLEKKDSWDIIVPQKKVSLLLENQGKVLKMVNEFFGLERKIHVQVLEELEKEKNSIIVWNGNLTFDEYQRLQ